MALDLVRTVRVALIEETLSDESLALSIRIVLLIKKGANGEPAPSGAGFLFGYVRDADLFANHAGAGLL